MGFLAEAIFQLVVELPLEWLVNRAPGPVAMGCTIVFFGAFAGLMIWAFFL